jgi:D-sedoheptulose 7-phosphate isomerase
MDYYQIIADNFQDTIETIAMSVDALADTIERSSQLMATALLADRKIFACGNGVDGVLAQLFVCNLVNRFEEDRPALPALALGGDSTTLTAIASTGSMKDVFSRQLRALGQADDVLLCICSAKGAGNLVQVVQTAHERNMSVILLSNTHDTELGALIQAADAHLQVSSLRQARIVEIHTMVILSMCELIDHCLFGTSQRE